VTFTQARVSIQQVAPVVDGGRYPARRSLGEAVEVDADIVCDSHEVLAARVLWRPEGDESWRESPMAHDINDRWVGTFEPEELGRYEFTVLAWVDRFATWQRDLRKRSAAGTVEEVDLATGAELVTELAAEVKGGDRQLLRRAAETLADDDLEVPTRVDVALSDELSTVAASSDPRRHASRFRDVLALRVDRERARFSSWYELFPRSAGAPGEHGTLRDVIDRLDYVASMGFDVLYLPPIHPIGTVHRKGPNNATTAGPEDPGSPWAIGSAEGGHKSVHPELGTVEDVETLVAACREHGLELAMDIAFQCAPDHPYVSEHPEWFRQRPDGSIQYAENPPKKYQDIYPFDFETEDAEGLWTELKSIFEFWIDHGVEIFRVDNPHTKSFRFWEWCIDEITREHPGVIFLAEAFTRPKVMKELAKRGFTQSYTYFAWRQRKWEIEEYYTELFQTDVVDYFRPNSWPNTPDILTEQLQFGGRAMYVQRLVLAATLTANYGMYGPPFELMESEARPGAEEYLDNEKYQLRDWDLTAEHSLEEVITLVNSIRHEHPALQQDRDFTFHHVDNDELVVFSKRSGDDVVLVVVCLDTQWEQSGFTWLDLEALGVSDEAPQFQLHDLFAGGTYLWEGRRNYVELDPQVTPAHIFHVRPVHRTERDFEYYA
jgi:starch synthase (maltosyl-transferring)